MTTKQASIRPFPLQLVRTDRVDPDVVMGDPECIAAARAIAHDLAPTMPPGVTADDCQAWAIEGLWDAARRWQPTLGPLLTFARPRIHGAVVDGARAATGIRRAELRAGKRALRIVRDAGDVAADETTRHNTTAHGEAVRLELVDTLREKIAALPEDQRAAVIAVHFEGKSQAEFARELGLDRSAVCRRLAQGLAALRTAMLGWEDYTAA